MKVKTSNPEGCRHGRRSDRAKPVWISAGAVLVSLVVSGCPDQRRVSEYQNHTASEALQSQMAVAAEAYVRVYGELPPDSESDFVRVMEGDNEKEIFFLRFPPETLDDYGNPINSFGNPITISVVDGRMVFRSASVDPGNPVLVRTLILVREGADLPAGDVIE